MEIDNAYFEEIIDTLADGSILFEALSFDEDMHLSA